MNSFAEIIAPLGDAEFFEKYWNRKSLHLSGADSRFHSLLSWSEVGRILEQHRLTAPRLRLELDGKSEAELECIRFRPARRGGDIPYVDVKRLYTHLREGATLVLDSVDEFAPNVKSLCETLEAKLQTHVETNAYLAWGRSPGFGVHWDDHDLFVLQIAGRKRWQMFEPTRPFPLYRDVNPNVEAPTQPIWERNIEPGDFIYIPRGHWHGATGLNEPTLHITIGVNVPSGIDLITWIADQLRANETLRSDLPYFASRGSQIEYLKSAKTALDEVWSRDDLLETFLANRNAERPARPHISMPYGGKSGLLSGKEIPRYSGTTFVRAISDDGGLRLKALGQDWAFPMAAKPLVDTVLANTDSTIEELANEFGFPVEEVTSFCDKLLAAGLIYIIE